VVGDEPLTCTFVLEWDSLEVAVMATSRTGRTPARDSFAWTVLTALAGQVDASAENGTVTLILRKRRGWSEGT
jgi:serine/threonine-protein kinase RsbW